jgi:hypothetical protein
MGDIRTQDMDSALQDTRPHYVTGHRRAYHKSGYFYVLLWWVVKVSSDGMPPIRTSVCPQALHHSREQASFAPLNSSLLCYLSALQFLPCTFSSTALALHFFAHFWSPFPPSQCQTQWPVNGPAA